ncbi:hypothetical protein Tco_0086555 [Tanacetum coccineum]
MFNDPEKLVPQEFWYFTGFVPVIVAAVVATTVVIVAAVVVIVVAVVVESLVRLAKVRTSKLRNDILMFQQHQSESLSEAWTHFKDFLQKFPHHGIDLWLQI